MTELTKKLYNAWQSNVKADRIINEFKAPQNDPDDRWSEGDTIIFGIKSVDSQLSYYAENVTKSKPIHATVEQKPVGKTGFICQFNGYRALRPGGSLRQLGRQADIPSLADQCRFFCQDSKKSLSLRSRVPLEKSKLSNFTWNAYYNASPFEKEGHFLWIPVTQNSTPENIPHFSQLLTREFFEDAVTLFYKLNNTILFFNSLHAGASVNHIHLQAVYHMQTLPIERATITHYRGYDLLENYPAEGFVFSNYSKIDSIFKCINYLQLNHIPFNLIMLGELIVLVPRNINHEIVSEFQGGVLATMEMCGKIITVDSEAYENIDDTRINAAFKKTTISTKLLIDTWNLA